MQSKEIVQRKTLKGKNVLVTGGAGFVGGHLVDRLIEEEPASIVVASNFFLGSISNLDDALKRFPVKIVRCDVADFEEIKDAIVDNDIEVVFNLAVIPLPTSLVKPEWTIRKNIEMTINICQLLREKKFKTLIQYSSSEAFGSAQYVPMDGKHPLDPETPYAASKAATDHIALSYHHTFGCDVAVVRPFNQYGPRQNVKKYAGIIPLMVGKMVRGEDVTIFGDGEQTRDFMYVGDTADLTIEVYKNPASRGRVINAGSGREVSIKTVLTKMADILEYTKPFVHLDARPGDVRRHCSDISEVREVLGWEPKTSFEEGLRKTVEWYRDHPEVF